MSTIGEVLATATLSFTPSHVVWSGTGQVLVAFVRSTSAASNTGLIAALDAATGDTRWTKDTLDARSVALCPDGRLVAVAGRLGRVEAITEFVEFQDCNEFPPQLRDECERFNREEAGRLRVVGHTPRPPDRLSAVNVQSGTLLWGHDEPTAETKHLTYSPDGRLLAASGERILLLDPATGDQRGSLFVSAPLLPTAFSRDSKRLVAVDSTRVTLIDLTAGATKWVTSLPEPVTQFTFAENDSSLVVSTERQVITLNAETGDTRSTVDLQDPLVGDQPTVLGPGGRRLVTVLPGTMTLWDAADGSRLFETPVGNSAKVRFNPVLPEIAIASAGGVKVVNSRLGTTVWEQATDPLHNLVFSADGRRLALCGGGFVRVHNMNPTSVSHRAFGGPVKQIALASSPGPVAVAVSQEPQATATVFHADTGEPVLEKVHPGVITSLALSPEGRHFATGGSDGGARLFTSLTGEKLWQVPHNAPVNALAFLPADGDDDVITAAGDKTARRLAHDTGAERWKLTHPQAVTLVTASLDGRFVATACTDRSTRILNPATGQELFRFPHDGKIRAIAFSPQGSMLATGGDDGAVLIIDTATGRKLAQSLHTREVTAAAFSHDGKLLATAGKDHAVQLFNVTADPPKLTSALAFPQTIIKLAFHPTEPQLALVNDEPSPTVTIIDPVDGTELGRLAHPGTVNGLAYSPDGKLLATACEDTLARVYPGRREP
ncbi:PQQ-binding-like beta-propeller repeat protein [Streptomyces sp. ISL-1]|uniref:WD40 repeat domain-containing protein n=1 Tax=Streptomyces sp. ISL-1 TaxID=2817657 RepID=UPI001BE70F5C|nr:PQQ-binding-like beta-propeller repeat protein [Streptomyces sp. ISL-1]MBT2393558.1 PQQ-binding-like beta-propeller repeat protein [Streptomyces sp. ISL-1]